MSEFSWLAGWYIPKVIGGIRWTDSTDLDAIFRRAHCVRENQAVEPEYILKLVPRKTEFILIGQ